MPKKVDTNQGEIVRSLRQAGAHVQSLASLGKGVPDLLVTDHNLHTGRVEALLVELKTEKGKLTPDEVDWHGRYPEDGPLIVARTVDDVLRWFGRI